MVNMNKFIVEYIFFHNIQHSRLINHFKKSPMENKNVFVSTRSLVSEKFYEKIGTSIYYQACIVIHYTNLATYNHEKYEITKTVTTKL